eukprot:Nk52_evm12s621 gene=Nk52_evmTU12s621
MTTKWTWYLCGAFISALIGILYVGVDDGQLMIPTKEQRIRMNIKAPKWSVNELKEPSNSGGKSSLEEIVQFVNGLSEGIDGIVGTKDDPLGLNNQMFLIMKMLKVNHPEGYFAQEYNWHFSFPGGLVGELTVLYADSNEYVALYGTPLKVEGYSGVWNLDIYDFMFKGFQQNYFMGELTPKKYFPSTDPNRFMMMLPKGMHKYVNLGGDYRLPGPEGAVVRNDGAWMLEYGYGNVFSTFWQAIFHPTFFYSLDFSSAMTAMRDSSFLMYKNLMKE